MTALTWITSATEATRRAESKLRWALREERQDHQTELLAEAADELRVALARCDDSLRSLRRDETK